MPQLQVLKMLIFQELFKSYKIEEILAFYFKLRSWTHVLTYMLKNEVNC